MWMKVFFSDIKWRERTKALNVNTESGGLDPFSAPFMYIIFNPSKKETWLEELLCTFTFHAWFTQANKSILHHPYYELKHTAKLYLKNIFFARYQPKTLNNSRMFKNYFVWRSHAFRTIIQMLAEAISYLSLRCLMILPWNATFGLPWHILFWNSKLFLLRISSTSIFWIDKNL